MHNIPKKKFNLLLETIIIILPVALLFSVIIAEIIILTIIIFFFLDVNKSQIKLIVSDRIFITLFILTLFLIINYFINFSKEPSITRSFFFIRFPLFVISLSYFLNKDCINLKKIFVIWSFILIVICIDLQLQNITGKNILGYQAILQGKFYRLGGFLDDELKIAHLINCFFVMCLGFIIFYYNKNIIKTLIISIFLTFLVIHSVYITGERSNFISLLLFVIIFFLFSNLNKYIMPIFGILILGIIFNFSQLEKKYKFDRMIIDNKNIIKKMIITEEKKEFLYKKNHYFSHYSTAFQIFRENPLMGVGLKNFRHYCNDPKYDKKIHPTLVKKNCTTHPHNLLFEILSELGGIGAILFFSSFFYIFYIFIRNSIIKKNIFLFGNTIFLITYFIPLLPKGSFFTNWNAIMFWTIFAINCYLVRIKNNTIT
jgi:hypothetical protein